MAATAPATSAKLVILSEARKIFSRSAVKDYLDAEELIKRHEREAQRNHQPSTLQSKKQHQWCLQVVPRNGNQYSFHFLADGPGQKTNPEVLTRDEAQRFLALRRVQLE